MEKYFTCPFCEAIFPDGVLHCPICGEDVRIAILVCSMPSPGVPPGASWILGPRSYTAGRDESCDIILHDPYASKIHFELVYSRGRFRIKPIGKNFPAVGGKVDLKCIHAGDARLSLSYIRDEDFLKYDHGSARAFRIAFSSIASIRESAMLNRIAVTATDAVLRISGMEKAYFFDIAEDENGDLAFEFIAARSSRMTDLDSRFCPVSTDFCRRLIEGESRIIMLSPEKLPLQAISSSVRKLNLQMLLGIKFSDSEGVARSIIYADTSHAYTAEDFEHYRPALGIFSRLLEWRLISLHYGGGKNPASPPSG